jgi:hypothetical protein
VDTFGNIACKGTSLLGFIPLHRRVRGASALSEAVFWCYSPNLRISAGGHAAFLSQLDAEWLNPLSRGIQPT